MRAAGRLGLGAGALAGLLAWTPAYAQTLQVNVLKLPGNVLVTYETVIVPESASTPDTRLAGGAVVVRNVMKRYVVAGPNTYFGYDMRVLVTTFNAPGFPTEMTASFEPLTLAPEEMRTRMPGVAWEQRPLATPQGSRTVKAGEVIEIDLFANPTTGQKVIDRIRVTAGPEPFARDMPEWIATQKAVLRDLSIQALTAADVELRLRAPRLSTSTRQWPTLQNASAQGRLLWVIIPGVGRVTFSLVPRDGFGPSGHVEGSRLTFDWLGGTTFFVESAEPILPAAGRIRLYARIEPAPKDAGEPPFAIGTALK